MKGAVLDENMQKLLISDDLLFITDKLKMAEKNLLIYNFLVTPHEGFTWVRIYMPDGGIKMLHAASVLGHVEEWKDEMIQCTKKSIFSLIQVLKKEKYPN